MYKDIACDCCGITPSRNVNIYTKGSEGTQLCERCALLVTELVRGMIGIGGKVRMACALERKKRA